MKNHSIGGPPRPGYQEETIRSPDPKMCSSSHALTRGQFWDNFEHYLDSICLFIINLFHRDRIKKIIHEFRNWYRLP